MDPDGEKGVLHFYISGDLIATAGTIEFEYSPGAICVLHVDGDLELGAGVIVSLNVDGYGTLGEGLDQIQVSGVTTLLGSVLHVWTRGISPDPGAYTFQTSDGGFSGTGWDGDPISQGSIEAGYFFEPPDRGTIFVYGEG